MSTVQGFLKEFCGIFRIPLVFMVIIFRMICCESYTVAAFGSFILGNYEAFERGINRVAVY